MSESRKITIVATRGQKIKSYETSVKTWGELINLFQSEGDEYDLSEMKAVENINKTTLEHVDSVLPEGPFRIFLRPEKTKSGSNSVNFADMSFKDMRKDFITSNKKVQDFLKEKFGRNWTLLGTTDLRKGLTEYQDDDMISTRAIIVESLSSDLAEEDFEKHADDIIRENNKMPEEVSTNYDRELSKKRLLEQCSIAKVTSKNLEIALTNITRIVGNSEILTDQEAEDMAEFAESMKEFNAIAEGFLR